MFVAIVQNVQNCLKTLKNFKIKISLDTILGVFPLAFNRVY